MNKRIVLATVLALAGCGASIHDLAAHGDTEAVAAMIQKQPSQLESTNELGKTPLHYAVTHNQPQTVARLLDLGANFNAQDITGLTPLHIASIFGYTDVAGLLFAKGAKLDLPDDFGNTPLHSAAMYGNMPIIERLLDWGSDATATNNAGLTPAALAQKYGKHDAAALIDEIAAELQ